MEEKQQRALVAPMNTMADNIGGNTVHSFGKIPSKGRRGIDISVGGRKENAGICGEGGDWHELRFILFDEIEAAGAGLTGKLEANVRERVPSTNAVVAGLRKQQHHRRERAAAFAGVSAMFFGISGSWTRRGMSRSCQIYLLSEVLGRTLPW